MIRKLQIENYRCLRDVRLDLEPLTVFLGANGSGKSSVFSALTMAISDQDRWRREAKLVRITVSDGSSSLVRVHQVGGSGGAFPQGFPRCQLVQLDLHRLRQDNQLNAQHQLASDGLGLANLLASIPRRTRDEIARQYCGLVPIFADVDLRPIASGTHTIAFQDKWTPSQWYLPRDVSDGSMLLLAFLLLPYQSPPPDVIAIEEPERGLHPYLMGKLVELLRKLTKGEVGPKATQVLLATHSAELLRYVEAKEVRFFSRASDTGETRVELAPTDDPSWIKTMQEYDNSLGDLWLSGGLGGVPRG